MGGYGGGMMGGMGGYGGGMMGGMGGYGGGMMGGMRGGMGGYGGGMMGGNFGGGGGFPNISMLFGSISDLAVGETPSIIGMAGLSSGGTGALARAGGLYGGGLSGATGAAGLGGAAGRALSAMGDEPEIVRLLRMLIDDVYEPGSSEPVSRMIYVPHTNLLIVHNTPTNIAKLEKQLAQLDVTPKQVSIEAKFLTVKTSDLKNIGFRWNIPQLSDMNNQARKLPTLTGSTSTTTGTGATTGTGTSTTGYTYNYDINGDGVAEPIPFYSRPDGTSIITNTIASAAMAAFASPGAQTGVNPGSFSLTGVLTNNKDGDNATVAFDYLSTLEESELLSAPRVTTMNRKPAVIADLSSEYYVAEVRTELVSTTGNLGSSGNIGYTQSVMPTRFDFGITLSVTPQISGSDQVRLWLNPQVTAKGSDKTFVQRSIVNGTELNDQITLPNMTTQAVWTNVIVHDGDTLVLGGLVADRTIKGKQKMPYLGDIPILGFFFRGKSKSVSQSSLLIFVTPTIIDTTGSRFFEAGTTSAPIPNEKWTPPPASDLGAAPTTSEPVAVAPVDSAASAPETAQPADVTAPTAAAPKAEPKAPKKPVKPGPNDKRRLD